MGGQAELRAEIRLGFTPTGMAGSVCLTHTHSSGGLAPGDPGDPGDPGRPQGPRWRLTEQPC